MFPRIYETNHSRWKPNLRKRERECGIWMCYCFACKACLCGEEWCSAYLQCFRSHAADLCWFFSWILLWLFSFYQQKHWYFQLMYFHGANTQVFISAQISHLLKCMCFACSLTSSAWVRDVQSADVNETPEWTTPLCFFRRKNPCVAHILEQKPLRSSFVHAHLMIGTVWWWYRGDSQCWG